MLIVFFILQCVFKYNPEDTISKELKHTLTLICVSNLSKNRSDQENLEITLNLFHLLDHFSKQKKYLNNFEFSKIEILVHIYNQSNYSQINKKLVLYYYIFLNFNLFKRYIIENINLNDISKTVIRLLFKGIGRKIPIEKGR